ncbi:MAG: hypothetical protein IJY04_07060 [Clostridia bacterium]|nr:hypothetical protein [Clostridia bacterium]
MNGDGTNSNRSKDTQPPELTERENKELRLISVFAFVGLALCIGSFILLRFFPEVTPIAWGICLIDVIYTYVHARVYFKVNEWKGSRFIPLMMVAYWIVAFAAVLAVHAVIRGGNLGEFDLKYVAYPIFLMPTFDIQFLLLMLIISGV